MRLGRSLMSHFHRPRNNNKNWEICKVSVVVSIFQDTQLQHNAVSLESSFKASLMVKARMLLLILWFINSNHSTKTVSFNFIWIIELCLIDDIPRPTVFVIQWTFESIILHLVASCCILCCNWATDCNTLYIGLSRSVTYIDVPQMFKGVIFWGPKLKLV